MVRQEPPATTSSTRRGETGTSLVEVMIAMTILVVGVLGLFSSYTSSRRLEQSTLSYSARVRIVNDAVERLRNGSLVTRAQEFVAQPKLIENGQTLTMQFPVATLTKDLPKYASATSPFLDVNGDGKLDVVAANGGNPGILAVRMSVGAGADPLVVETLVLNR
jgi:type II secretory pathway pseudopilin PulG